MIRNPRAVIRTEPVTCISTEVKAQKKLSCCSNENTSSENVENVVMPPHRPVIKSNLHTGSSSGCRMNHPSPIPMMKPPIRFTINVPGGRLGNRLFRRTARSQRIIQPTEPPIITARSDFKGVPLVKEGVCDFVIQDGLTYSRLIGSYIRRHQLLGGSGWIRWNAITLA